MLGIENQPKNLAVDKMWIETEREGDMEAETDTEKCMSDKFLSK